MFAWIPIHQEAFGSIKQVVSQAVTFAYPDFTLTFKVYTNSSDYKLGGVII